MKWGSGALFLLDRSLTRLGSLQKIFRAAHGEG